MDASSVVITNIGEYLKQTKGHDDKCIGCANCLSPHHQIIQYKYPKQINSRYNEQFKNNHFVKKAFSKNDVTLNENNMHFDY